MLSFLKDTVHEVKLRFCANNRYLRQEEKVDYLYQDRRWLVWTVDALVKKVDYLMEKSGSLEERLEYLEKDGAPEVLNDKINFLEDELLALSEQVQNLQVQKLQEKSLQEKISNTFSKVRKSLHV